MDLAWTYFRKESFTSRRGKIYDGWQRVPRILWIIHRKQKSWSYSWHAKHWHKSRKTNRTTGALPKSPQWLPWRKKKQIPKILIHRRWRPAWNPWSVTQQKCHSRPHPQTLPRHKLNHVWRQLQQSANLQFCQRRVSRAPITSIRHKYCRGLVEWVDWPDEKNIRVSTQRVSQCRPWY